jgi:hypothetical protein
VDVVLNDAVVAAAGASRPLKAFVIDLALGQVGEKHKLALDAKFKLPKMAYKGAGGPEPQRVRAERKALVTEVVAGRAQAGATKAAAPAGTGGGGAQLEQRQGGKAAAAAGGGGAAAAGADKAAAAAAPAELAYSVACEGRPVKSVRVTVQLGPAGSSGSGGGGGSGSSSGGGVAPGDVRAEVCGREVFVSVPGAKELAVTLPFAVTAAGATAVLGDGGGGGGGSGGGGSSKGGGGQALTLTLPYLPLREWVVEAAAAAPRAFGELPVAPGSYMELS